jgi:hypothetical protein
MADISAASWSDIYRRCRSIHGMGGDLHLFKFGLNYRFGDTPCVAAVTADEKSALPFRA